MHHTAGKSLNLHLFSRLGGCHGFCFFSFRHRFRVRHSLHGNRGVGFRLLFRCALFRCCCSSLRLGCSGRGSFMRFSRRDGFGLLLGGGRSCFGLCPTCLVCFGFFFGSRLGCSFSSRFCLFGSCCGSGGCYFSFSLSGCGSFGFLFFLLREKLGLSCGRSCRLDFVCHPRRKSATSFVSIRQLLLTQEAIKQVGEALPRLLPSLSQLQRPSQPRIPDASTFLRGAQKDSPKL